MGFNSRFKGLKTVNVTHIKKNLLSLQWQAQICIVFKLKIKVLCRFRAGGRMISVYFLVRTICWKTIRPAVVPTQPPFHLITWVLSTQENSRLVWSYHSPYLGLRLKGVELYLYLPCMFLWCGEEQLCLLISFVKQRCFETKLLLRIPITDIIFE